MNQDAVKWLTPADRRKRAVREQLKETAEIAALITSGDDEPLNTELAAEYRICHLARNRNEQKLAQTMKSAIRAASQRSGRDDTKLRQLLQAFPQSARLFLPSAEARKKPERKGKTGNDKGNKERGSSGGSVNVDDEIKIYSHTSLHFLLTECEGDNDEVFESIFIAAPEVAGLGNTAGETPLHLAVKKGYLRIVRNLSSRAPHLCRYLDKVGNLPVHIAVGETSQRNKDAPLITSALLANYPRGLVIPNGQGYLPVHLASTHGFAAGLRGILAINSGAVFDRAPQLNGQILPIEFALAGHRRIMDALGKVKSAARCDTSSAEGCATLTPNTSVHGIISGTPYDDDIQIDCFSDVSLSSPHTGVQSRDERELLDQKQGYEDCIEMLLISALYRRTVLCPRDEGHEDAASVPFFLPLHAAFAHRLQLENWHHLLRMYKMLHSSDIDRDGRTLLHACADACDNEKCRYTDGELTKMIQQVHEMDSTCHTRPDFMGLLPIQLAVLNGASAEVIKTFAKCGPGSASTRFMPISM